MKNAKDFFNEYAQNFDALYGTDKNVINSIINPIFRRSMKLRFEKTMGYTNPVEGKTILDVGCGPGHYAVELAKRGAKEVVGIDFSEEMIAIAQTRAEQNGVSAKCQFLVEDVFRFSSEKKFDYSILMGFMDYIEKPKELIEKMISLSSEKILFSFPKSGGILALQRKIRYRARCPLYLYDKSELQSLFSKFSEGTFAIETISRDYFVSLALN